MSLLLQLSVVTLPFARPLLEAASDFAWEWGLIGPLALMPVTVIEVTNLIRERLRPSPSSVQDGNGL